MHSRIVNLFTIQFVVVLININQSILLHFNLVLSLWCNIFFFFLQCFDCFRYHYLHINSGYFKSINMTFSWRPNSNLKLFIQIFFVAENHRQQQPFIIARENGASKFGNMKGVLNNYTQTIFFWVKYTDIIGAVKVVSKWFKHDWFVYFCLIKNLSGSPVLLFFLSWAPSSLLCEFSER